MTDIELALGACLARDVAHERVGSLFVVWATVGAVLRGLRQEVWFLGFKASRGFVVHSQAALGQRVLTKSLHMSISTTVDTAQVNSTAIFDRATLGSRQVRARNILRLSANFLLLLLAQLVVLICHGLHISLTVLNLLLTELMTHALRLGMVRHLRVKLGFELLQTSTELIDGLLHVFLALGEILLVRL